MTDKFDIKDIGDRIKAKKRRKWYLLAFMMAALIVVLYTANALLIPAVTESTDEEHPTLSYLMYSNMSKTHRAYLEYAIPNSRKAMTQGVLRQSVLYVYAYAGETICLGSDVTESLIDINENSRINMKNGAVTGTPTGADIVVVGPDGTVYSFDNDAATGLGYIGTVAQEQAGANFTGSGNTAGYIPHEFVARETGLYEVRFHSYSGYCDTVSDGIPHLKDSTIKENTSNKEYKIDGSHVSKVADPVPTMKTSDEWYNSGCTVGAFDITVVSDGKVKKGRTYSRLLALNIGYNSSSAVNTTFYGDFYIVTDDGYIYRNTFSIDPYGFIFFVNSRGIVDDETGYSAYHSIRGKGQDSNAQIDMKGLERYSFYNPQSEDSLLDRTYMIFFELPDPELEGVLYARAYAPDRVENVEFIGSKEGNITYVGNGGYFKFDIENAVSVTITIDFSSYNAANGTDFQNTYLNANVTKGTNFVYWNSYDGAGTPLPAGWYKDGQVNIRVEAHAGEFHFPYMDVECSGGIKYERVNRIYEYTSEGLSDITDKYADTQYKIYYNNTLYEDGRNSPAGLQIGDGQDHSDGIDSHDMVMKYGTGTGSTSGYGDYSVMDVWAYASSTSDVEIQTDIVVENIEGFYTVTLEGLVFFDKDNNAAYELIGGDFPINDVNVSLDYNYCGTRWSIVRDDDNNIIALLPAYESTSEFDEDGITVHEVIQYYYHDYEVHLEDDGRYHIYSYDYSDRLHEGTAHEVTDINGDPVTADIHTEDSVDPETGNITTTYCVWIPVHRETTTSVLGKYYFPGVLVNENMYTPPEGLDTDFVITVTNPDPHLYTLTTQTAVTGDFGTTGIDNAQIISLSAVEAKIEADIEAMGSGYDPDQTYNFTYEMADVGYYYPTYEPPLTIAKNWGSTESYRDIQSIVFGLEGFVTAEDGTKTVYYRRDVTLDFYSWSQTLSDLPAFALVEGVSTPLSYRVTYERFVKGDSGITYVFAYDWNSDPPTGQYYSYVYDEGGNIVYDTDGEGHETPRLRLLARSESPFETFIYELKHIHTGDYIYIENWPSDTSSIVITKVGADDNISLLENATFQLQVLNRDTGRYDDVKTAQGKYTVTTDENGKATFHGLSENAYRLVEIVPPDFYSAVDPITFVVSKDPETGTQNADVLGSYYDDYSITIYDHLLENPVSVMNKIDQYGHPIAGAQFAFYKCDDNYNYTEADIVYLDDARTVPAIVTFDSDGTATLTKTVDGRVRSMYVSELRSLLGENGKFVLKEVIIPDGYRGIGEAHMRITGDKLSSYIICDNPYESGVWVEPIVTVYAPETLQVVDMSQLPNISSAPYVDSATGEIDYVQYTDNGKITSKGTLFAVVVKRNGAEPNVSDLDSLTFEDWAPVYGNAIDGYHTISNFASTSSLERICQLINMTEDHENIYVFGSNANGTLMYTKVENLPDRVERYFTYMDYNKLPSVWRDDIDPGYYSDPQFAVLYYYSTASSLDEVTPNNTARVTSHGLYRDAERFTTHFATNIMIPDISNNIYVQKSNAQDKLINNAVFGVYKAVAEENGTGYYIGEDAVGDPVYIVLSEDEDKTAEVYTGTVDENGVLTNKTLIANGEYSFNTAGCEGIPDLPDDIHDICQGILALIPGFNPNVGVITVNCDGGDYYIKPTKNGRNNPQVAFTHDECDIISEVGTAHFRYLLKGKYYVREVFAPAGFDINYTNIEVFVGNEEVYANAGETDDGVSVGNGAGYVVSTLNQFASKGDIRETLTYIVAAMRLNPDYSTRSGFTDLTDHMLWPYVSLDHSNTTKYIFEGTEPTGGITDSTVLYLMYNGSGNEGTLHYETVFDYCVNPNGAKNPDNTIQSLLFWTKSGWSDLAIFQHKTAADDSDVNNPEVLYTDISLKNGMPNDISMLFSGSTFIRVEDQTKLGIKLKKTDTATLDPLQDAKFVLYKQNGDGTVSYYTVDEHGEAIWQTPAEGQTEMDFLCNTDINGEYLFKDIELGEYRLKEVVAPAGYWVLADEIIVTVTGDTVTAATEKGQVLATYKPTVIDTDEGLWIYTVNVTNNKSFALPKTGGIGTNIFTVIGLALLLLAAAVYIYKKLYQTAKDNKG